MKQQIFDRIENIISVKPNAIIAIDGCCAAGKTTLAKELVGRFGAQVIHMDDFFLTPEMRTEQRLAQPGGNVYYERLNDEVVTGLLGGAEFTYRAFSCKSGTYAQVKSVKPSRPVIIEGVYALHPQIPDIYDLKIFLEISYGTQLERILRRNGSEALEVFKSKWIPLENKYFSEFGIKEKCDYLIINE